MGVHNAQRNKTIQKQLVSQTTANVIVRIEPASQLVNLFAIKMEVENGNCDENAGKFSYKNMKTPKKIMII